MRLFSRFGRRVARTDSIRKSQDKFIKSNLVVFLARRVPSNQQMCYHNWRPFIENANFATIFKTISKTLSLDTPRIVLLLLIEAKFIADRVICKARINVYPALMIFNEYRDEDCCTH